MASVAVQLVVLGAIVTAVERGLRPRLGGDRGLAVEEVRRLHAAFWRWQRRVTGGLLVGLGLRLAWMRA